MKKYLAVALAALLLVCSLASCVAGQGSIDDYTPEVDYLVTEQGTFYFEEAEGETAILVKYNGKATKDDHVIIPSTFKWLTNDILFEHLNEGMLFDPETNIRYGTYYLSYLYDRYGDWELALAAYNGGPGNVDKWLEDDAYADGKGGLQKIPFKETRQFVSRVSKAWEKYDKLYS